MEELLGNFTSSDSTAEELRRKWESESEKCGQRVIGK